MIEIVLMIFWVFYHIEKLEEENLLFGYHINKFFESKILATTKKNLKLKKKYQESTPQKKSFKFSTYFSNGSNYFQKNKGTPEDFIQQMM